MTHATAHRIHIGTSGWSYGHWRGPFYPPGLPEREWLAYYVERLHSVEINNTFYRLPTVTTLHDWREAVAEDFIFSVKASQFITHMKKLKEPEVTLTQFFERIEVLTPKLGPILFQLPPHWRLDLERLRHFLAALPTAHRYAFEFRDPSWWVSAVYDLLARHDATFCCYELAGMQSPRPVTSDIMYVRLHGPDGAYQGCYDRVALAGWIELFTLWVAQGRQVYCYFDNDQHGYAALNAMQMQAMIGSG